MSWHVRYIDPTLKHGLLSPELASREEALETAWILAQDAMEITAIEGPDEEPLTGDAISAWFDERAARENSPPPTDLG